MNEGCRDGSRGAGSDATIIPYFFIYVKSRYARSLAPCEMTGRDKRCLLAWLEENDDEQNRRPHRHLRRRRNADRSVASHRQHNKCPVYSHTDVRVVSEDPRCRLHTCKESCGRTEFHKVITGYSD